MVFFGLNPGPFGETEVFVRDDNSAIVVNAGLAIGVSGQVSRLTRLYPEIKNIVLDGPGDSAYEARALFQIIQANEMNTFSLHSCSSACSVAFSGGGMRLIAKETLLGFHAVGAYGGQMHEDDLMPMQKIISDLLLRQGISKAFVEQVFRTPHEDIWLPSSDVLLEAGVNSWFCRSYFAVKNRAE